MVASAVFNRVRKLANFQPNRAKVACRRAHEPSFVPCTTRCTSATGTLDGRERARRHPNHRVSHVYRS